MNLPVSIQDIERARDIIAGQVQRTPSVVAPGLSNMLGVDLTLKLENLQRTGSFKDRGAYVKLQSLGEEKRARGVIAMSAGNHAQGVAYHANRLGIPATIVMPAQTPFNKVGRTRQHGAAIELYGRNLAECGDRAQELIAEHGFVLVHPYDDPAIISGQGTVGLEMLEDTPDLDVIVVPIGGGGLISGTAIAAKARRPDIKIIGVEAALYPSMHEAINDLPPSSGGETVAEGIAVKKPGELTRQIIAELVDDIILVAESDIERAIHALVEEQSIVAEGAGAAGLAAVIANQDRFAGLRVGVVICGGNIDSRILASVLMRGLVRDHRLVRLRVEINDEPGVLSRVTGLIGNAGGNIVDVIHQRLFQDVPVKQADLDLVVETRNEAHLEEIKAALVTEGYKVTVLSTSALSNS
jgi:threonine dehydratase